MSGELEDLILRTMARSSAGGHHEHHGMVTSYDPDKHLGKVTIQPGGQETGWIPIETGHIGNGYGVLFGLQPGDGKSKGDQVVARFQEGDFESGKIVQRVHSNMDKPPAVQSGEMMLYSKFQNSGGGSESAQGGQGGTGQQIYFKNDGSLKSTDGNGATTFKDGKGNITVTTK